MRRMLLAMSLGVVAACGSTAAPAGQAPIANAGAAAPAPASPCELGWLEQADRLVVTESSNGHFGFFEFRAELGARVGGLTGTAWGQYKRYPGSALQSMSVDLRAPHAQLAAVLAGIARGADVPETQPSRRRFVVMDSSQTRSLTVEMAAQLGGVPHHARLEAEHGESEPQPWSLVGCERTLPYDARVLITKEYGKLEQIIQRNEILTALMKRTP